MLNLTRPEGSEPEDFHVTRRGAAGLLLAGYAVAAFSADAAPITTSADGLVIETADIANGAAGALPAYIARPKGTAKHGAVLVVSEIFGVHEWVKDICRRLAREGYVAIAPDFFYRSGVDLPKIEDRDKIMAVVAQASDTQVDADVRTATAWLKAQSFVKAGSIGIIGYCWGGQVVWRAGMVDADVKAGVAFYGQLKKVTPRAAELKVPVLGLYGGKDQGITQDDVAAMKTALKAAGKADSDLIVYPDAGHGFLADYRASYDAPAATDAWKRMLAFLRGHGVS